MIKPILFRGGMYGDLIIGMVDPSSLINTKYWQKDYTHSSCSKKFIKYTRTFLKKFFQYNDNQKKRYYNAFEKIDKDVYFLTHDTDFSLNYKEKTIQLVCSDLSLLTGFAERFEYLHRKKVVNEAKQYIDNKNDFVEDYRNSLQLWQEAFIFPNRFDIKNIFQKNKFMNDLKQHFSNLDEAYAGQIYDSHMVGL